MGKGMAPAKNRDLNKYGEGYDKYDKKKDFTEDKEKRVKGSKTTYVFK